MAQYPIPNPQFGIYNNNNFSPQPTGQTGLTIDDGKKYFLTFPNAQTSQTEYLNDIGVGGSATFNAPVTFNDTVTYNQDIEFTQNVVVDGTATVNDNLLCLTTAEIDGILTCNDDIDMNSNNITQIGYLSGTTATQSIGINSTLLMNTGIDINMVGNDINNVGILYVGLNSGTNFSTITQVPVSNQLSIFNSSPNTTNNNSIAFNLKTLTTQAVVNVLNLLPTSIQALQPLYMNGNNINNVTAIQIGGSAAGTYTYMYQSLNAFAIQNYYPYASNPSLTLSVYNASNTLVGMQLTPTGVAFSNLNLTSINNVYATAVNVSDTTAGTISSISQSSGQCVFNNNSPYSTSPQYNFALYTSSGYASIFNISPALTTIYTNLNMNGKYINNVTTLNSGLTGGYVTTNTPTAGDNSGKIATTSYVTSAITAAQGTAFTDFTFTNIPITGNAVTLVAGFNQTSIQTTNVTGVGTGVAVQFLSTFFQVNIASQCTAAPFFQLLLNVPPWPSFTSGSTYSGVINGIGSNTNGYGTVGTYPFSFTFTNTGGTCILAVTNSNGATLTTGYYYQFNLMSLGFFNPT